MARSAGQARLIVRFTNLYLAMAPSCDVRTEARWYFRPMKTAAQPEFREARYWVVNMHTLRVVDCSESAAALWGYRPLEIIGVHAESLIHPDELPRAREVRSEHVSGDGGIWKCVRKDGTVFFAHLVSRKGVRQGRVCTWGRIGSGGVGASLAEVQWSCRRARAS